MQHVCVEWADGSMQSWIIDPFPTVERPAQLVAQQVLDEMAQNPIVRVTVAEYTPLLNGRLLPTESLVICPRPAPSPDGPVQDQLVGMVLK